MQNGGHFDVFECPLRIFRFSWEKWTFN